MIKITDSFYLTGRGHVYSAKIKYGDISSLIGTSFIFEFGGEQYSGICDSIQTLPEDYQAENIIEVTLSISNTKKVGD